MSSGAPDGPPGRLTRGLFALGVLVLVTGVAVGSLAAGASLPLADGGSDGDQVDQVDPSAAGSQGDLSVVERRLADQVASRVQSGALNLSGETVDRAREAVNGSDVQGLLDRYADVAERTGQRNRSRALRRLQRTQSEYARLLDRYWDLHGTYRNLTDGGTRASLSERRPKPTAASESDPEPTAGAESSLSGTAATTTTPGATTTPTATSTAEASARTTGTVTGPVGSRGDLASSAAHQSASGVDGNRTRRVAREMERTWEALNETGTRLVRQYRNASRITDTDYGAAIGSVRSSVSAVADAQAQVRDEVFVETRLRNVTVARSDIAFTRPLVVTGRVETAAGDPIVDETIAVHLGNRTVQTRLDGEGRFDLSYRPTSLRLNASSIRLSLEPPNESVYLGDQTTVPVRLTQVSPTVDVDATAEAVGYGDDVTVTGRVHAGGVGVPEVPYVLTVGDRVVAVNRTEADGRFERTVPLTADVPSGEQPIAVTVTQRGRAIGNATGQAAVTVERREPQLSARAEHRGGREVGVDGELTLPDGTPVVDQRVGIRLNETFVATATTGPDGRFETVVLVPEAVGGEGAESSVVVTASFDGGGTNLASDSVETTVVVAGALESIPVVALAALGGLALVALLVLARRVRPRRRLRRWIGAGRRGTARGDSGTGADTGPQLTFDAERPGGPSRLDAAADRLGAGQRGEAVQLGYAALREQLAPAVDDPRARTHWEFYRACAEADVDPETTSTLERVTALYERVTFAAGTVSEETAREALANVRSLEQRARAVGQDGARDADGEVATDD